MPRVWVVRADGGKLTDDFISGRFASIGWDMGDLTSAKRVEAVRKAYDAVHAGQFPPAAGNISGQIHSFMNLMEAGDVIVTPALDSSVLRFGEVRESEPYFEGRSGDHHHSNRRDVSWRDTCIFRARLPDELRANLRDRRTVFLLSDEKEEFLGLPAVGQPCDAPFGGDRAQSMILERIHEKIPAFFELLIAELLKAMGCIDPEVRGGPGDQGVDVYTTVRVPFADSVAIYVQAKRYKPDHLVDMRVINKLNGNIPGSGRGLIITTSDFKPHVHKRTAEEAPSIYLINGPEFAEQLLEHWDDIPEYFREQLGPLPK